MQVARVPSLIRELDPTFQVALVVKNPPANSGGARDVGSIPALRRSLEEGMANHSSIFAWRIPWAEEPWWLQSMGPWRVRHVWSDLACTGEKIKAVCQIPVVGNMYLFSSIYWPLCVCRGVSHHGDITDICKRNERTKVILLIGNSNSSCKEF